MKSDLRPKVLFLVLLIIFALTACQSSSSETAKTATQPSPSPADAVTPASTPSAGPDGMKTVASGLQYQDLTVGVGQRPLLFQEVRVAYVGKLADGHVFDRGTTDFKVGKGEVIKGWEQGILGGGGVEPMRVGGKRKLIIPPKLGYGDKPYGTLPASSTLTFEVELLRVNSAGF